MQGYRRPYGAGVGDRMNCGESSGMTIQDIAFKQHCQTDPLGIKFVFNPLTYGVQEDNRAIPPSGRWWVSSPFNPG